MTHAASDELPRRPSSIRISIMSADDLLLVTLRFSPATDREALECCMLQIVEAFQTVEGVTQRQMPDLCWERKRVSETQQCVTLRCPFSDPDFPQKFEVALQRLTGELERTQLH